MEFTDNLKGKLEEAKSEEEAKKILEETKKNVEDAGVVLDDAELDKAKSEEEVKDIISETRISLLQAQRPILRLHKILMSQSNDCSI